MCDLEAIALLQDPARRSLYDFVVAAGRAVSRNEAAQAVGVQRTLAAFHLDRLASAGLLDVAYRRAGGRSGPGAGRPAKVYSRTSIERAVSVPPRDYGRAAQVLADAVVRSGAEAALYEAARAQGISAGSSVAHVAPGSRLDDLERDLTERGYEPYVEGTTIRLRNCPFHGLAQAFPVVACGMNLALLDGLLAGAELAATTEARLAPRAGECCVVFVSRARVDV
jgi:predicted ArsR family transcriptional regulator